MGSTSNAGNSLIALADRATQGFCSCTMMIISSFPIENTQNLWWRTVILLTEFQTGALCVVCQLNIRRMLKLLDIARTHSGLSKVSEKSGALIFFLSFN